MMVLVLVLVMVLVLCGSAMSCPSTAGVE